LNTEDHTLLSRELDWRSRPGDRRRPPGSNAITAVGIVLTLVQWAVTTLVLAPYLEGPPGSGVIAPRAIVAILVYGIEMLIAAAVATRVWVAIGPGARTALRPIAVLGPWPMLGIAFLLVLYVASFVAAPFLPKAPELATSGRNWRLVDTGRGGVTYEQAVELCGQAGERVPSRDDLAAFDPPFPGGTSAWIERPADEGVLLSLIPDGRIARQVPRSGQSSRENVICFRP
jgi:hypothetical protein